MVWVTLVYNKTLTNCNQKKTLALAIAEVGGVKHHPI